MTKKFDISQSPLNQFEATTKDILERYYLTPYPEDPQEYYQKPPSKPNLRDGHIERQHHGAMHASRVAAYTEHFHKLHQTYDSSIDNNLKTLAKSLNTTPKSLLMLTKYAALFHDSARQDDGVDYWDGQSAENGRRYLVSKAVPKYLAELFALAAEHKGSHQDFINATNNYNQKHGLNVDFNKMSYLRSLIADGDCLDIIRVRSKYDMQYLNIFKKFKQNNQAQKDIIKTCELAANVIALQHDACHATDLYDGKQKLKNLIPNATFSLKSKCLFEQAQNPYTQTVKDVLSHLRYSSKTKRFQNSAPMQNVNNKKGNTQSQSSNTLKNILMFTAGLVVATVAIYLMSPLFWASNLFYLITGALALESVFLCVITSNHTNPNTSPVRQAANVLEKCSVAKSAIEHTPTLRFTPLCTAYTQNDASIPSRQRMTSEESTTQRQRCR